MAPFQAQNASDESNPDQCSAHTLDHWLYGLGEVFVELFVNALRLFIFALGVRRSRAACLIVEAGFQIFFIPYCVSRHPLVHFVCFKSETED